MPPRARPFAVKGRFYLTDNKGAQKGRAGLQPMGLLSVLRFLLSLLRLELRGEFRMDALEPLAFVPEFLTIGDVF